ncbi:glycosyltransferase family 2 protein [Candidatus Nomurabacteria bacterium]|nr:glycosyltransferase family 2 protein [Candidatus Nomurabacteria bacterium]
MKEADISIVIVNWKVRALVEKCLKSVLADTKDFSTEIFLVDNDSRDGTPEMIMAEYPEVTMIALPYNRGFASANNLALKQSSGKYLFLLNPDTEVQPGFFKTIINYLETHPEVGILGPRILNSDFSLQESIRRFPSLLSQLIILLKLRHTFLGQHLLKKYLAKDFDYNREEDVEQIMGAAMVIRREAFEKIGYLDEKFFVWFEEVDYCQRAIDQKIVIRYLPTCAILHHNGASFKKQRILRKQLIFNKSLIHYFYKHKPFWQLLIILLILPVNILLTAFYSWWFNNYQAKDE